MRRLDFAPEAKDMEVIDVATGAGLSGTRRTELLLAPGLQYTATERLFLDLSVQLPLASDVDRGGLASDWNALASFRFAF